MSSGAATTEPVPQDGAPGPTRLAVIVALACMLNPLNGTLIASSVTEIAEAFHISFAESAALIPIYMCITAALQPLSGAIGDRVGRRRALMAGVLGFCLISILAAMTQRFSQLVVCRCLQAGFTSLVMPNAVALLREAVPEHSQGKALGTMGAMIGIAAALGFPLGSWVSGYLGWRALFWISVPLGAVALLLARRRLPRGEGGRSTLTRLAWVGTPLLPLVGAAQLLDSELPRQLIHGLFGLGVLAALAMALWIRGDTAARADLRAMSNRAFGTAFFMNGLIAVVTYTAFLVLPTWLTHVLHVGTRDTGGYLGFMILTMVFFGPAAGRATDSLGPRITAVAGCLCTVAALHLLTHLGAAPGKAAVLMALAVLGAGLGTLGPPLGRTAMGAVPPEVTSLSMGLFASMRFLGAIVGALGVSLSVGDGVTVGLSEGLILLARALLLAAVPMTVLALRLPSSVRNLTALSSRPA